MPDFWSGFTVACFVFITLIIPATVSITGKLWLDAIKTHGPEIQKQALELERLEVERKKIGW